MTRRWLIPTLAAGLLFTLAVPAPACPFCGPPGQTLAGEVSQADFILFGTLSNPKRDLSDPDVTNKGTTELKIDLVIKPHAMVKGKKTITIPRYIPPDPKNANVKYLIFFNIYNDQLDPYRGEAVAADSKLPQYLKGAIEVRGKDAATRLRYFFDYLEDPELVVSTDAYSEFGAADYKEVRAIAEKLPAATLLKWLKDPNTRPTRYGLYGLMLGHCGKATDAKALRTLLDDPDRSYSSGLDGMLAGYTLLDPKAGWDYLLGIIRDPAKEFPTRYAALKTVRFFWELRHDVIGNKQVLDAMAQLMSQPDLADLPMEDLRKWKCWELTPTVLGYAKKESHTTYPIVNRAILKFAIAAAAANPANTEAVAFVASARVKDPKKVEFLQDLIKDEEKPATPPATPPAAPATTPRSP